MYKGAFGEWSVDESDVKEVLGYRAGLSVAAAGECAGRQLRHFGLIACFSKVVCLSNAACLQCQSCTFMVPGRFAMCAQPQDAEAWAMFLQLCLWTLS